MDGNVFRGARLEFAPESDEQTLETRIASVHTYELTQRLRRSFEPFLSTHSVRFSSCAAGMNVIPCNIIDDNGDKVKDRQI